MQVLVHTDNHIEGGIELSREVESVVESVLGRFKARITRVEVHLSDVSSAAKSGENDKRCAMEARLGGLQPIATTHLDSTVDQAVAGAAEKMLKTLDRTLGKLSDTKGQISHGGDQTI